SDEVVDDLAEATRRLPPQPVDGRRDVVVEGDRRTHASILTSRCASIAHHDAHRHRYHVRDRRTPGRRTAIAGRDPLRRPAPTSSRSITPSYRARRRNSPTGAVDKVAGRRRLWTSAPDLGGGLDDQLQLRLLLVVGEQVALHGGGEAALR